MIGALAVTSARPWLVARFGESAAHGELVAQPAGLRRGETASPGSRCMAATSCPVSIRRSGSPTGWRGAGLSDAVAMMTSRNVESFVRRRCIADGVAAECVVTLGLNNGERVGTRLAPPAPGAGTINILCHVSQPLTDAALLEAASIVAQARTVVLTEAGYRRPGQEQVVTGTGTDCIVMASPLGPEPIALCRHAHRDRRGGRRLRGRGDERGAACLARRTRRVRRRSLHVRRAIPPSRRQAGRHGRS